MQNAAALRSRRRIFKYAPLFLMLLPGTVYFFINNYLPMFGLVIAFKSLDFRKGLLGGDWIGFRNFEYLFRTTDALFITRNTILFNLAFIVLSTVVAITLAIMLNEVRGKILSRFFQSVILLPYLMSMVIISYLVFAALSAETGFVNNTLLPAFELEEVSWYGEPKWWVFILPIVNTWKGAGFLCVIYLASIVGIDVEYYEAARLEGAGKFEQIRSITLPLIQPVVTMMTLLAIGRIFYSDFGLFFQVPQDTGALYEVTNVIDTYVYHSLIQLGDIGMSSAAGVYQSVVGFTLVFLSNLLVRRLSPENALF